MRPRQHLLFTVAAVALSSSAYAQPFLYSMRQTQPCSPTGCAASSLLITNARTGEVVNADDPPLLGPSDGHVRAMTTSVDGKRLYLSIGFARPRLLIMNLVTNRIDTSIPMPEDQVPWFLLPDPGGRVLYASNPLSARVTVLDEITGQATSHVQLTHAFTMAVSADGSLLAVTEPVISTVTLLDPRTLTVRLRVNVGNSPQRIAMTRDGTRVFVTCFLASPGGVLVTIDTATGAILNSTPTAYRPDRVAHSPITGKIYLTMDSVGVWGVIDGAGTLTLHSADIPRSATMAMSDDGRRLYIAGLSGIVVIDTATDTPAGSLAGGSDLYLAVSTPCDFVLPSQPSVFNAAGGTGTLTVPAPAGCQWAVQNASIPPQIQITSGTSGVGPGSVTYSVAPSATPYSATIRIAQQFARVSVEIPRLWIDTPRDATVTSPFVIAGWTLAESVGATASGIDVVHAWAFPANGDAPRFLGSASMDGSRPDVAAAFGPGYGRSGFSLTTPWLRPGLYQISVYGRSRTGQFDAFAATTVTTVGESTAMALDFPSTGLVVQPGTANIFVAGWALDRGAASGTGADIIHAWAFPVGPGDPMFLGGTATGTPRPDVGAFFGARFTPSGFSTLLPAPRPGVYDLAVFARSTATGVFDQWRVVRITVLPP
jgi:DNA-binding beta-propeller fold protein YncE